MLYNLYAGMRCLVDADADSQALNAESLLAAAHELRPTCVSWMLTSLFMCVVIPEYRSRRVSDEDEYCAIVGTWTWYRFSSRVC